MSPRPPLANTIRLETNWQNAVGRQSHNIAFALVSGTATFSDPAFLSGVADALLSAFQAAPHPTAPQISNTTTLLSVTASDNTGGSEATGTSLGTGMPGTNSGAALPPQVAVCYSWQIAARYRGGKPRWYIPGIPQTALITIGDSQLSSGYSTSSELAANSLLQSFNSAIVLTHSLVLGTISYFSGGALRGTPLFRPFVSAKVHSRLDSQRRRSGKESTFPVVPG